MIKIVVGGQLDKEKIAQIILQLADGCIDVEIQDDITASMNVKGGIADYYIGACNTGGGGALAMPIALLGSELCATLSMPSKILSSAEIIALVAKNIQAFGFTAQHAEAVLPILIPALLEKQ
jgi:hypothetical protein